MTKRRKEGYYDLGIDIEEILVGNGMVSDLLSYKDLQQRKLFLNGEINQFSIADIVKNIMQYNCDDRGIPVGDRQPILLYITSHGGDVYSGYSLIDTIETSETPVYTINLGFACSMAFMVSLAGHKRYTTPNATFLLHDGYGALMNSTAKLKDALEFQAVADKRDKAFVLAHSKIKEDEYDEKFRADWYMFPEEAKERGCVDYIIGVDCTMNDIV